jgi:hypothetical protein
MSMDRRVAILLIALTVVLASSPVVADDLTGHDRFLCSIGDVTMCTVDWESEIAGVLQEGEFIDGESVARIAGGGPSSA